MQIIKNQKISDNHWQYVFELKGQPAEIISEQTKLDAQSVVLFNDWQALSAAQKNKVKAIAFTPEDEIKFTPQEIEKFALIGIIFPSFNEGRGYTQANIVRQQLEFKGELRAINAYRDNLLLLDACGFDAFDLVAGENVETALTAFDEIRLHTEHR